MERATYLQLEGSLCPCGKHLLACRIDPLHRAGDHDLTGTVIVGRCYNVVYLCAKFLNLLVGESQNSCHRRGTKIAGLLHRHRTLGNKTKTILEAQCAGCDKC